MVGEDREWPDLPHSGSRGIACCAPKLASRHVRPRYTGGGFPARSCLGRTEGEENSKSTPPHYLRPRSSFRVVVIAFMAGPLIVGGSDADRVGEADRRGWSLRLQKPGYDHRSPRRRPSVSG